MGFTLEFVAASEGCPWWLSGKVHLTVLRVSSKEAACQFRRLWFNPWAGKIPWRRKWPPTPVFLPGKSHGQRSLVGYIPWGHKRVRRDLVTKTTKQQPAK